MAGEPSRLRLDIPCPHCRAIAARYDSGSKAGVRRANTAGCVRVRRGHTIVTCGACGKDFRPHERRVAR